MNYHDLQGEFEARHAGYPDGVGAAATMLPSTRYILPTFGEHTAYDYKRQDPYVKLFEDRIVLLGEQVDDNSADDVMAQLLVLRSQDPDSLIIMYIDSPGGLLTAMTTIYDTTQYIRPEIQTVCLGRTASTATVLLVGRSPGECLALPNTRVLTYQPAIQDAQGQATNLAIIVEETDRTRARLEETLSRHSGHTLGQMHEDVDCDKTLTAAQAKEYGLIDQALSSRKGSNN